MEDRRPQLAPALERLLAGVTGAVDALGHVDPRGLLLVAGQARGAARASIRPLVGATPEVRVVIDRRRRLYEITLRPLWFRASTLERRLEALVHELWHIDPCEDGKLDPRRKHGARDASEQRAEIRALTRAALTAMDDTALAPLGHDGEVLMPAWLERPVLTGEPCHKAKYTSKDLYLQPISLMTPSAARTVWW